MDLTKFNPRITCPHCRRDHEPDRLALHTSPAELQGLSVRARALYGRRIPQAPHTRLLRCEVHGAESQFRRHDEAEDREEVLRESFLQEHHRCGDRIVELHRRPQCLAIQIEVPYWVGALEQDAAETLYRAGTEMMADLFTRCVEEGLVKYGVAGPCVFIPAAQMSMSARGVLALLCGTDKTVAELNQALGVPAFLEEGAVPGLTVPLPEVGELTRRALDRRAAKNPPK